MSGYVDGQMRECVNEWISKWVDKLMSYGVNNYQLLTMDYKLINTLTHSHINKLIKE
jgi:hypothetical protein